MHIKEVWTNARPGINDEINCIENIEYEYIRMQLGCESLWNYLILNANVMTMNKISQKRRTARERKWQIIKRQINSKSML